MTFTAHVKVKGRWIRVKMASLEMLNEVIEQWKARGFVAFGDAS